MFTFNKKPWLLIGGGDIGIVATALADECPVITANMAHFERVPNLEVLAYR